MRKFIDLPPAERRLVLKTLLLVAAMRSGLSLLSFPTLRRVVARLMSGAAPGRDGAERIPVARIAWCVQAASRYVPHATCLTQALTMQILMARRGYPAELRIGVARDGKGAFNAHAWVEHEGRVVIGALGYEEFTPLPQIDAKGL